MLRFVPQYKNLPWGGRRLAEDLDRRLPEGPVGESWELCDFAEHHSVVAEGTLEGATLGDLWRAGDLGGSAAGDFPFLLKWLDTQQSLSVQVHPTVAACAALGEGRPKTEAWLVAHSDPGATLHVGHYPGLDGATLAQAARGGTVAKWMYETQPRRGDMILVEAGTLHAIGPGFLLLEVQQPSDTTYRLYDWGRVDADGEPRELHVEAACKSVRYDVHGPPRLQRNEVRGPTFVMGPLRTGEVVAAPALRVVVAYDGAAVLASARDEVELHAGDVCVIEPADGSIELRAGVAVLIREREPPAEHL